MRNDMTFLSSLSKSKQLILDGATGTELNRRGVDTGLPLWSANALLNERDANILKQIHVDYLNAGADIITTNTFRTHVRALAPSGNARRALELTRRAVDIARDAIASAESVSPKFIAGSISTLEDCYRPDLVPPDDELRAEHSERVHHMLECGVDFFLIETINTIREAVIIAKLAAITGAPVVVSFVCNQRGKILSGETLTEAARELLPLGISAIGVNCGPTPNLAKPLAELESACGKDFPLIAYGNIGYADEKIGWVNTDSENPKNYCEHAVHWRAKIIGGCCGTTPEHIRQLKLALKE
jgi:S-methylmethionine-dependent homocysteine/selenocysteine methylase